MTKIKIKKSVFVICLVAVFLLGGSAGYFTLSLSGGGGYAKLDELKKIVNEQYYEKADENNMMEGACKGLISGLGDPYSSYMTAKEYKDWKVEVTGEFEGIGISFAMNDKDLFEIHTVYKGSPAAKAGLKKGDIIVTVDGKEYTTDDEIVNAIRGKKGTKVKIQYYRDKKLHTVTIVRDSINVPTVTSKVLKGDTGYIKIDAFESKTSDDFNKHLASLQKKNIKNLIIDLRNNGGGLVTEALDITGKLVGKGTLLYVEDKNGKSDKYSSDSEKIKLPYVVLVNENTASASEILSAAVKDYKAGKIVGTKTYGKGVIQDTNELNDGSALKLTVMQYFSPKHHKINKCGVKPDYVVKLGKSGDAQLAKAYELLN